MKTTGVRVYGKEDLRLETWELPDPTEDEILAKVVVDSMCMSTTKLVHQGNDHKRVTRDLREYPGVIGHEMCGEILLVGERWKDRFVPGSKFVMQVNMSGQLETPGYSYAHTGGDATYILIPKEVMEKDCLLTYRGDTFFEGALVEPLSCLIAAFDANYHLGSRANQHEMGIKEGGTMLMMGATGPMGLLGIDLALHGARRPKKLVITDVDDNKLKRAQSLYISQDVEMVFLNTSELMEPEKVLKEYSKGEGYDDIFVFAPVPTLITMGSALMSYDGCMNFFAGPSDRSLQASVNFYDIHYNQHHYVGTSGGDTEDLKNAIRLIEEKKVDVAKIVTHILGLKDVAERTINLPYLGGGKKLVYTHKNLNYTDLTQLAPDSKLDQILRRNQGVWSKEAEDWVLNHCPDLAL